MSIELQPSIGVIADDFTGAMDSGAGFVRAGFSTALLLKPMLSWPEPVHIVSTNSRNVSVSSACQSVVAGVEMLEGRRLFKKIDSTMRGHIGEEIEAVLQATGISRAVVCPAVIEAGRCVRDGLLWVNGKLLHETDFAQDPYWPATSADMADLVGRPTTHVGLTTVRDGVEALDAAIRQSPDAIVTVDACTTEDMQRIGQAAIRSGVLPCGAMGLATVWGQALVSGLSDAAAAIPCTNDPILVIVGTQRTATVIQANQLIARRGFRVIELDANPVSTFSRRRAFIDEALSEGQGLVLRTPSFALEDARQRQLIDAGLSDLALQICQYAGVGALVVSGGETASNVFRALDADGVRIMGEFETGIPWGMLVGGMFADRPVVTKAGGFGNPDSLVTVVDVLRRES
jgi:uncharacterized protein YgbK (DUF1537 family)